jgi:hypothetical protein
VSTLEAVTTPSPRRPDRRPRTHAFQLALVGVSALVALPVALAARPATLSHVAPPSISGAADAVAQRLATAGAVKAGMVVPPRAGDAGAPPFRVGPRTDIAIPPGAVRVEIGQSITKAVSAAHEGDTIVIAAGVHRGDSSIRVPDGVSIIGEPGAVLNGSRVLSGFAPRDGRWEVEGVPREARPDTNAQCDDTHPMCRYSEDLYVDDVPQLRVASASQVREGSWFYDYARGAVVMGSDPTGHVVELSEVNQVAFQSDIGVGPTGTGVIIRNLVIEKYASRPQECAIMAEGTGGNYAIGLDQPGTGDHGGWAIEDNDIRLNHGCAVFAGAGGHIANNLVRDNGQTGLKGWGRHIRYTENEISGNNYAGFNTSWEAGGAKFWMASDLLFSGNWSHDNLGGGVWADYSLDNVVYEHNTITGNKDDGITQEMTLSGRATDNFIAGNNWYRRGGSRSVSGAIFVFNGSAFEIARNVMRGNNGGVVVQAQQRGCVAANIETLKGACPPGAQLATVKGVYVHDNDISMTDGFNGLIVLLQTDWAPYRYAGLDWVREQYEGMLVRFDHNTYRGTGFDDVNGRDRAFSDASRRFVWGFPYGMASDPNDAWSWVDRRYLGFGDWQRATGQDTNSTYVTS